MSWQTEFWQSIKSYDTEEKLDLYFYRPAGFLFAKIAKVLHLTPDMVTLAGVIVGISSGFYFRHNESTESLVIGSFLLIFAGVLDSSDGQLARMVGGGTKFGLVLDGLCDNLVFASAYIGSTLTIMPFYGPGIWVIAVLAGVGHSCQSAMLDFYNREYLFFGYGKGEDYWNPTLKEATSEQAAAKSFQDKLFWNLRGSWLWQQNKMSTRTPEERLQLKALLNRDAETCKRVGEIYRDNNRVMLRFWRLMGPNFHTMMILLFVFARRFDLYLIAVDIFGLTLALFCLRLAQRHKDEQLFGKLKQLKLWS